MYQSRLFAAFGVLPCGLLSASLLLCGCEKSDKIKAYTVKSHDSLQTTAFLADHEKRHPKPKRMIGVVIPRGTSLWFFKLEGNVEAVEAREKDLREFLKSVHFSPQEKLEWALPDRWQQLPATQMRYATLVLDGEPALEMSVTQLPTSPEVPLATQVVSNINRWRNQLSLPPIDEDDLARQSEKLTLDNSDAYWINIVGRPKPKPPGMQAPPGTGQPQREAAPVGNKSEAAAPTYQKPEGWIEGKGTGVSVVSMQVVDGDSSVAITVTPALGGRLANVNRWRGQMKLEPLSADDLAASAKIVEVGKLSGELFEMTNDGRTIFGVIVEDRGQTWFVKMVGDAAVAQRERPKFEAFLKSLRFE